MPLSELLALRNAINAEITKRGHIRTATSLEGELMERVVADAYGGELTPPTNKSVDVVLQDGTGIQVKVRSLRRGDTRFWSFEDFGFDSAVVISMDRETSEIIFARELTRAEMQEHSMLAASGDYRLRMGKARSLGLDVTARLREAYGGLR
jgi:hypothetical protein